MKIKNFYLTVFCITLILIVASCSAKNESETESGLDAFAKCLSDNGIKMYGAYWCPHCQKMVPIVEELGKEGYPSKTRPSLGSDKGEQHK